MSYATIKPKHFDYIMKKIRKYFDEEGLTECYLSDRVSILSSCEDYTNIKIFEWDGEIYPHRQTTQVDLEFLQLLEGEKSNGYFSVGTSHRVEVNPVKNRHSPHGQFILIDVESNWDQRGLINFQKGLLRAVGINPFHGDDFPEITYKDACEKYGVDEIGHDEERQLCVDFNSPAVFLTNFTYGSNPFWNMKKEGDHALKVDVIIGNPKVQPMETFGSAERSCNADEMRELFYAQSEGKYSKKLFDEFGRERVEKELDAYLALNFTQRAGMGIGLNRFVFACESLGIFDHLEQ